MDITNKLPNDGARFCRAKLIDAMNAVLNRLSLYDEETFAESLSFAMGRISEAADVDRLAVFRHLPYDGDQHPVQIMRWDAKSNGFTDQNKNTLLDMPFARMWNRKLNDNICLTVNFSALSEDEQDFMHQYGARSLFIVPVFIRERLWGEMVFQDSERERTFENEDEALLRSVSMILINAYIRAQTEHKYMEESFFNRKFVEDLMRRENMLNALNQTAMTFLSQHGRVHGGQLYRGMKMMAGYANINRVCVWKREMVCSGSRYTPRYTLYRKWSNVYDIFPDAINEGGIFPLEAFLNWDGIFNESGYIHCRTSELNSAKQEILKVYGVNTLLVFPIFSREGQWGSVSFDNSAEERLFKDDEVDTLHYASLMLGSVIVRDEEVAKTREAETRIKLMLDATPLSCQLWDRNFKFIDCNEAAFKLFDLTSKEELREMLPSLVPEYQPGGESSQKLGNENLIKAFAEGGTVYEWMYQMPGGAPLPTEVTLKRLAYKGGFIVAGYARDLRKIKLLESEAGKIYFDPLTGIYNRRYLDENLIRTIKTLSRSGGTLSFMIIDIDRFKEYNDTYGHIEGDECLRMVAETLRSGVTRTDDFVARYGGEEFAVVLPNTDEDGAHMIARRLISSVLECERIHPSSDINDFITISIGVTTGRVTPLHNEQDFINSADNMMYKAKREGRNRYCFQSIS